MTASRPVRIWLILLLWAGLFAGAILYDRQMATWVQSSHVLLKGGWVAWALKLPGHFLTTLAIAAALITFHRRALRAALPLVLSGPLVGIVYTLSKWMVGRKRPVLLIAPFDVHPFAGGWVGLIHAESGLCFPSGHTALAFATAACLCAALPRWAALWFLGATAVAAERVLENAHYLSDVVAGAGVGILCGILAIQLSPKIFSRGNPVALDPAVSLSPQPVEPNV